MLYKRNKGESLDMELFRNPTSEYRATPFWSWNCDLNEDILVRHIDYLKQTGYGGFHMHPRAGLSTEYLGEEYMNFVKVCCDKAKREGMLAWLYDEDRWPSGFAGGFVTKTPKYRSKRLLISPKELDSCSLEEAVEQGLRALIAVFDVELDADGYMRSYRMIDKDEEARGLKRYAYFDVPRPIGRYNNQCYVDTLSGEAIREFIRVTYEAYKEKVGDEFDKTVPAIFTDEPQTERRTYLKMADSADTVYLPWTEDLPESFRALYGYDIVEKIPELFWDLPGNAPSRARLCYHDHVTERFVSSYSDQLGEWCKKNGIALTGHGPGEHTLETQTSCMGEAIRLLRSFDIPGMDLLSNGLELSTAKQTQSVVHQYGREGMMSELYGVTNWDFDFRGLKYQGDWQAALGVTVRVPHLVWISMKGSAKRDYPASLSYQSPWYKEYHYIEDYYARLNTVLTRGRPLVDVAVIHPIESFWLHWGPADTSSEIRGKIEREFGNITSWLLTNLIDFDYISEALLPTQRVEVGKRLSVGEMSYKVVVVPACENLRRSTLEVLKSYRGAGGRVLFVGECPRYIDAEESDEIRAFYGECERCDFSELSLVGALREEKTAELILANGQTSKSYVHTFREDSGVKWLFLAHAYMSETPDLPEPDRLKIIIPGIYRPEVYDAVAGEVVPVSYENKNGRTYIYKDLYAHDSLLLRLTEASPESLTLPEGKRVVSTLDFKENISYIRDEDNLLVLDMAEYKLDDGEFMPKEEMLIIDDKIRQIFGYPTADGFDAQPWVIGKEPSVHTVTLRFSFDSRDDIEGVDFAAEEVISLKLNGEEVELCDVGYYVDESIRRYKLGSIRRGRNTIELVTPIGKSTSLEYCYVLGDFDVELRGTRATLRLPEREIGFGDIVSQGLPFYGGNISYKTEINLDEASDLRIIATRYKGACVKVLLDGEDLGHITYAPHTLDVEGVSAGRHTLEFNLFGYRVNAFGMLHYCGYSRWFGTKIWYSYKLTDPRKTSVYDNQGFLTPAWSYEYTLKPIGILKSPLVQILK